MNADIQPALERIKELESEADLQKDRADAAEERYRDDLGAACRIVLEHGIPTGHAESFAALMDEVLDYTEGLRGKPSRARGSEW